MSGKTFNERLMMSALLRVIARVPAGEKLNIRMLREPLGIGQSDAIALLEELIAEGRLDARTLRPSPSNPTGADVRSLCAAPSNPTGAAELLAEITAFCDARGVPPTRFGRIVIGDANFVNKRLREVSAVRASTAAKVREAIADPPAALVAERKPGRPHRPSPRPSPANGRGRAARDPTLEPVDPGMEMADKHRLNGQRHQAEIRRGQEREAAALLDAGVDPSSVKSTYQGNVMRQIQRRRADEARQADPVEQAKLALQRKGWRPVCSMAVHGGRADLFMVGSRKNVTKDQLIDLARRA